MPASASAEPPPSQVRELTRSECFGLLANAHLGRVAVTDELGPVVFPVNFVLDRHTVVFRTDAGTKLNAALLGARVAFETGARDGRVDQQIWVLEGEMAITLGEERHRLRRGDCLAMRLDRPTMFHNPTRRAARYAVVIASERPAGR